MFWIQLLILVYLLISSVALLIFAYKKFLQYLSPAKGYIASACLIIGLLAFDLVLYNFTTDRISQLKGQQSQTEVFSGTINTYESM